MWLTNPQDDDKVAFAIAAKTGNLSLDCKLAESATDVYLVGQISFDDMGNRKRG